VRNKALGRVQTASGMTMVFGLKNVCEPDPEIKNPIDYWENAIKGIYEKIRKMTSSPLKIEDPGTIHLRLSSLEKEIITFHKYLGKALSSFIPPRVSETQRAKKIGKFRRIFQDINNAYGELKSKLLGKPCDEHICCMCHFSNEVNEFWPINNKVIEIYDQHDPKRPVIKKQSIPSLLVFTCGGGQGHFSATKAIGQNIEGKYHILVASTLEETLAANDVLKKFSLDFSQERLYNHLLKNEKFKWLKVMTFFGPFYLLMQQRRIEHLIRLEVLKQNPDILISCMPFMNSMFLNVAKEFNLPLVILTTDLDTRPFTKGMNSATCDLTYPHYRITLAYEVPEMRKNLERKIPRDKICISGFPVRPAFNETVPQAEAEAIRQKFRLAPNEKIVLIMMGGNAGVAIENYARIFAELRDEDLVGIDQKKIHALCLCGDQKNPDDKEMLEIINRLAPKSRRVRVTGIAPTSEIAQLMAISDVLITKPGGCTTNEALAKKLPMIFHAPFALMDWEVFNMEFCINCDMGARFKIQSHSPSLTQSELVKNKHKLLPLLKNALRRRLDLKNGAQIFEKKDFKEEFVNILDELLPKKS
jgi:processive 1,2-diacylglycerol beta-glucosyltransferase